ncbi:hypothetical protein [Streptomyces sp. NPDC052107]|uniref:hypothetical protein n=1 Tax=Streptomyces sp. NPDC052107 TaxID=3155632 RepID=UPI00342B2E7D
MTPLPPDHRTIDDLLAQARTRNRYASYDMAAAEARLRARQTARHRPPRPRTTDPGGAPTVWTAPKDERTPDSDCAWWDLNAVWSWWRFAAGVGHQVAEYRLFLEHAHSGEYHDADYWRTQLPRHHFEPTCLCGDRTTGPLIHPPPSRPDPPPHHPPTHPEIGTSPSHPSLRNCATSPPRCKHG